MKNKFNMYATILLIVSLFIGCSKTTDCTGKLATKTLKGIFKDEFLKNKERYQKSLKYMLGEEVDFTQVEKRFDDLKKNEMVIDLARPTDINEKLNSCKCQASLKLKISDNWKTLLKNIEAPTEYNIVYSVQDVNDKIIVETNLNLVTRIINIFLPRYYMEQSGEEPTMEH